MRYRRVSRCGYCGKRGHNRATCVKLKQFIERNPQSTVAIQAKRKEKKKKARKAIRQEEGHRRYCGYCRGTGHNKRTCPQQQIDRTNVAQRNREFRKNFIKVCEKAGFGLGTLIERKPNLNAGRVRIEMSKATIKRHGSLAVITGFEANRINCGLQIPQDRHVVRLRFPNGSTGAAPLPGEIQLALSQDPEDTVVNGGFVWSIAGKINIKNLGKYFEYDWHQGTLGLDSQLPGLKG